MRRIEPSLGRLRTVAGEGNRHCYNLLRSGRRAFLFAKYFLTSLSYFRGHAGECPAGAVAFIKGQNQLRHHNNLVSFLRTELGPIQALSAAGEVEGCRAIGRMTAGDFIQQLRYLVLLLASGRKRYLSLYFLAFSGAMERLVSRDFGSVTSFVCYNDQPYDVAAILYALHQNPNCRTIVVQHGLVLNEKFYFPTVAREFWAWGELSRKYYSSRSGIGKLYVKGRFPTDGVVKSEALDSQAIRSILVAPSFFHQEIKELVRRLDSQTPDKSTLRIAIKLHPATKLQWFLKLWFRLHAPWLGRETANMESLAENYDALATKNSTSAVDFFLRRKAVFFDRPGPGLVFPSLEYGFELGDIGSVLNGRRGGATKDVAREIFIRNSLNV